MANITEKDLLEAGVHYGHLTRKWNPRMAPYIYMEQNGIHIIDLKKTSAKLEESKAAIKNIARSGRRILFVATKKQARDIINEAAEKMNMPFVTERWLGGMLTNFATVRKSIKKMQNIEKMEGDGTFENLAKKERLILTREKAKLERLLGGISDLNRLPAALFIIDTKREHIAVAEAQRLNIPTFALVDTNSDPTLIDHPIPGNDDSAKSIQLITSEIVEAVIEGLEERRAQKEADKVEREKQKADKEAKESKEANKEEAAS
jgi:small subunit ribosomal protein S2